MNRLKEILHEKGIKQTWLAENWVKVSRWRTVMSVIGNNRHRIRYSYIG